MTEFSDGEILKLLGTDFYRGHVRVRRGLLGFHFRDGLYFESQTVRPFKPSGLLVWGAPDGALLRQSYIGNDEQVLQSYDAAPVRFFSTGKSYEQIAKMLDEGAEPPEWVDWKPVVPGDIVRIRIESAEGKCLGPKDGLEICMWGLALVR